MKHFRTLWKPLLACGIILLGPAGLPLAAQQASRANRRQPAQAVPAPSSIWKSETTGKEYRVRVENERFYAEWVNLPPQLAQHGAYIRTECRRVGLKWIGTSRSYLPCTVGQGSAEHIANWCRLLTRIEIDSIQAERISGRGEGFKRFDCQSCKILETVWANFVWVPKREGAIPRRVLPTPASKP